MTQDRTSTPGNRGTSSKEATYDQQVQKVQIRMRYFPLDEGLQQAIELHKQVESVLTRLDSVPENPPFKEDEIFRIYQEAKRLQDTISHRYQVENAAVMSASKVVEKPMLLTIDYLTKDFANELHKSLDVEAILYGLAGRRNDYSRDEITSKIFNDVPDHEQRAKMLDDIDQARKLIEQYQSQGKPLIISQLPPEDREIIQAGQAAMRHLVNNLNNYVVQLKEQAKDLDIINAQEVLTSLAGVLSKTDQDIPIELKLKLNETDRSDMAVRKMFSNPEYAKQVLLPVRKQIEETETANVTRTIYSGYLYVSNFTMMMAVGKMEKLIQQRINNEIVDQIMITGGNFASLHEAMEPQMQRSLNIRNELEIVLHNPQNDDHVNLMRKLLQISAETDTRVDKSMLDVYSKWDAFSKTTPNKMMSKEYHSSLRENPEFMGAVNELKDKCDRVVVMQAQITRLNELEGHLKAAMQGQDKTLTDSKSYYDKNPEIRNLLIERIKAEATDAVRKEHPKWKEDGKKFKNAVKKHEKKRLKGIDQVKDKYIARYAEETAEVNSRLLKTIEEERRRLAKDIEKEKAEISKMDVKLKEQANEYVAGSNKSPKNSAHLLFENYKFEINTHRQHLAREAELLRDQLLKIPEGEKNSKENVKKSQELERLNREIKQIDDLREKVSAIESDPHLGAREKMKMLKNLITDKDHRLADSPDVREINKRFNYAYDNIKGTVKEWHKPVQKELKALFKSQTKLEERHKFEEPLEKEMERVSKICELLSKQWDMVKESAYTTTNSQYSSYYQLYYALQDIRHDASKLNMQEGASRTQQLEVIKGKVDKLCKSKDLDENTLKLLNSISKDINNQLGYKKHSAFAFWKGQKPKSAAKGHDRTDTAKQEEEKVTTSVFRRGSGGGFNS